MPNMIKKVGFSLLMFYMLFTVTIESVNFVSRVLLYGIPMVTIALNWKLLKDTINFKNKYIMASLALLGFVMFISLVIPVLYGTKDFSFFKFVPFLLFQYALKSTFVLVVFKKLFKEEATMDSYLDYLSIGCLIYIGVTFFFIFFPEIREWWIEIIHISPLDYKFLTSNRVDMDYVTRVGIDGFGGFMHTFIMSTGVIISLYRITKANLDKNDRFKHYLFFIGFVVGTLLYGRSGSMVSYGCIVVLIVFFLFTKRFKKMFYSLTILGLAVLLILGVGSTSAKGGYWFNWNYDYLKLKINDIPPVWEPGPQDDELLNESVTMLLNSIYIPEGKTLLLGDGYYTDPETGSYYGKVDVGILRNVLFFGLPLSVVYYSIIGILLVGFYSVFRKKRDYAGILFVLLIIIQLLAFEIKGGVIVFSFPMLLPIFALLLTEKNDKLT